MWLLKTEGLPGPSCWGPGPKQLAKKWEAGKSDFSVPMSGLGAMMPLRTRPHDSATNCLQLQGFSSGKSFLPSPARSAAPGAREDGPGVQRWRAAAVGRVVVRENRWRSSKDREKRASLVAWWSGIHLPTQGTWADPAREDMADPAREDSVCPGAAKLVCRNAEARAP